MKKTIILVCMLLICAKVLAQSNAPVLVVPDPDRGQTAPILLSKLVVEAKIFGFITETKMTMTFKNPHNRILEGELYFPLPQGSTVSGYALDIDGKMVDGVVVEKKKARVVFEKEVRKGVDPGIVEWVKGNNFKTRVYPIPAKGSRTVSVSYVSHLEVSKGQSSYRLPLAFTKKLESFTLRVEVQQTNNAPQLVWQHSPVNFTKKRTGYFLETSLKNKALSGQLEVLIPDISKQQVLVEKNSHDEVHFVVSDYVEDPRPASQKISKQPKRIAIIWDASNSRAKEDHSAELKVLEKYFSQYPIGNIKVDLFFLRNDLSKPKKISKLSNLIKELKNVTYDGGTQLGALSSKYLSKNHDYYFLFSDGISNFGHEFPDKINAPLYVFSAAVGSNHIFLEHLANSSGGEYFNLNRLTSDQVLANIGKPAFIFISAKIDGKTEEVYPKTGQPIHGRFTLSGKLISDRATITLNYGVGGKVLHQVTTQVFKKNAISGNLLARFWAQKKVQDLSIFMGRNQKKLVELGKRYGLVTPGTSLIVLERLEQYLEHEIEPPRSLEKMRNEYLKIIDRRMAEKKKEEQNRLEAVISLWQARIKWWQTKFKYPKNFRYQAKSEKKMAETSALDGVGDAAEAEPMALSAAPSAREERPRPRRASGKKDKKKNGDRASTEPAIALKPWDPKTPYMAALKKSAKKKQYQTYLDQKKSYQASPAFYLDCAEFFFNQKQGLLAIQILSNIAEMELENPALLRILAHRLAQLKIFDFAALLFEEVLRLRPEEPQSYRDLALVLGEMGEYQRAMKLLAHVVMNKWDRFNEIEIMALEELNAMIPKAKASKIKDIPIDKRLIKLLDLDVRIVLTWDADLTDIDLWVIEPSQEKAYYGHNRTTIGGLVSRDFTQGYGPEEYLLKKAMRGTYKVQVNFYGSQAQRLTGSVTLQLDLFTNFGRWNQKKKSITLRLSEKKETITIGELEF
jgi:tetratricopeptide (TPR) repeat protein